MFYCKVNDQIELRLIDARQGDGLFQLFESNREHLSRWHPWVEIMRTPADVTRAIAIWQQQYKNNEGINAGIWFNGQLCGMISHLNVDWTNRWTALSYWLNETHQGQGIMTESCRALVIHGFETWKLNRITIECAAENVRSRAIPERLGFQLEGLIRQGEWLHNHFVDHAVYGLLRADYAEGCLRGADSSENRLYRLIRSCQAKTLGIARPAPATWDVNAGNSPRGPLLVP
jgi:ribosomal-protein-serine acetyltransferase